MSRTLDEVIADLPKKQQKEIQARYEELYAEELTLQELRKAQKMTQEHMAKALETKQGSVSKIEKRADMLLSTLTSYIEAMGGELDLIVRFPNRQPVSLSGFSGDALPKAKTLSEERV